MTANHQRLVAICREVCSGHRQAEDIPEEDWEQMLWASQIKATREKAAEVAAQILEMFESRAGYFSPDPESASQYRFVDGQPSHPPNQP